ncbi:MAG TPA: metal-sensitive transcriptional regulator [Acidimicrobiia bacterium]|nr:metal-sensitive transcriptional regulator [Acidimicrobiia bacterium]
MVKLNEESTEPISKRLKRAQGQLGAVIRMLEEGQDCESVVTQLSAVNKAISRAGYAMITAGLAECYTAETKPKEIDLKKLEKLFLSFA